MEQVINQDKKLAIILNPQSFFNHFLGIYPMTVRHLEDKQGNVIDLRGVKGLNHHPITADTVFLWEYIKDKLVSIDIKTLDSLPKKTVFNFERNQPEKTMTFYLLKPSNTDVKKLELTTFSDARPIEKVLNKLALDGHVF